MAQIKRCSLCHSLYSGRIPAARSKLGTVELTFCHDCFDHLTHLVQQHTALDPELAQQQELMEELKGRRRIVINTIFGGFGLSHEASIKYLELTGQEYTLEPQADRDTQNRLGPRIKVNGWSFHDGDIDRDDPALVEVVQTLGEAANGAFARLKVVAIPARTDWIIQDYDGREWIAERHQVWR